MTETWLDVDLGRLLLGWSSGGRHELGWSSDVTK